MHLGNPGLIGIILNFLFLLQTPLLNHNFIGFHDQNGVIKSAVFLLVLLELAPKKSEEMSAGYVIILLKAELDVRQIEVGVGLKLELNRVGLFNDESDPVAENCRCPIQNVVVSLVNGQVEKRLKIHYSCLISDLTLQKHLILIKVSIEINHLAVYS